MTEDEKKQVAVFRFSVISDFVNTNGLRSSPIIQYKIF